MALHIPSPELSAPSTGAASAPAGAYAPVRIVEIELSERLPALAPAHAENGQLYTRALVSVRLHTQPVGLLEIDLPRHELSASELARRVWSDLEQPINAHLRADGLPAAASLDEAGLVPKEAPRCLKERARFLVDAPMASVVVATRDRADLFEPCLRALVAMDYPNFEVLVVDNAPKTTAIADLVQRFVAEGAPVRYLREDRAGLSWARNCGLAAARGQYIAYTDDDVVVDRHWLTGLVQAFAMERDVVCTTGLVLPSELETPAQLLFEQFGGHGKGFTPTIFDMKRYHPKRPMYPFNPGVFGHGCSMMFRTGALRSIGGFDPALGAGSLTMAGEDIEVFFKLIVRGHRIAYNPSSLAYHRHRRDYEGLKKQIFGYGVGWSACLTKLMLTHPGRGLELIVKLPYGVFLMFDPRSPRHEKKNTNYPEELTKLDLKGLVRGPLAYFRSRRHVRAVQRAG